jgi:hypothetical protein
MFLLTSAVPAWKILFCLFFAVLGFELRAYTLNHSTRPFCGGFFQDRVSQLFALDWLPDLCFLSS